MSVEKIWEFLEKNNYNVPTEHRVWHSKGMCPETIRLKPKHNPFDAREYNIAVGLNEVIGYVIDVPFNYSQWHRVWTQPYSSKEQLLDILKERMEPQNCW